MTLTALPQMTTPCTQSPRLFDLDPDDYPDLTGRSPQVRELRRQCTTVCPIYDQCRADTERRRAENRHHGLRGVVAGRYYPWPDDAAAVPGGADVAGYVRGLLRSGQAIPGDRITMDQVRRTLGVDMKLVKRAWRELTDAGVLQPQPTGTIFQSPPRGIRTAAADRVEGEGVDAA